MQKKKVRLGMKKSSNELSYPNLYRMHSPIMECFAEENSKSLVEHPKPTTRPKERTLSQSNIRRPSKSPSIPSRLPAQKPMNRLISRSSLNEPALRNSLSHFHPILKATSIKSAHKPRQVSVKATSVKMSTAQKPRQVSRSLSAVCKSPIPTKVLVKPNISPIGKNVQNFGAKSPRKSIYEHLKNKKAAV